MIFKNRHLKIGTFANKKESTAIGENVVDAVNDERLNRQSLLRSLEICNLSVN